MVLPTSVRWGVIDKARRRQQHHRRIAACAATAAIALAAWAAAGPNGSSAPGGSAIMSGLRAPAPGPTPAAFSLTSCLARERNGIEGTPSKSLLTILGVLRRPATPADSLPHSVLTGTAAYLRYVRRARIVAGVSYYIYPVVAVGCGQLGAHDALALIATAPHTRDGLGSGASWDGMTADEIEGGGAYGGGPPLVNGYPTVTMVVPDGVASVTLRYPDHETRTAGPINNVLVIQSPRRHTSPWAGLMIWRAPDGHIIKTFHRL
jgi:hypothetical protein